MKSGYFLIPLIASVRTTASPLGGSDAVAKRIPYDVIHRAPDPPPAPAPFPPSTDGVLEDESVINFTMDDPSDRRYSCWTPPKSRPPPGNKYHGGTCSVCVVQRNGTDKSADYLLWARDNENNAMGNMGAVTVWPLDGQQPDTTNTIVKMPMGGSPLQLSAMLSSFNPYASHVTLMWDTPPQQVGFDPADPNFGDKCTEAGRTLGGAVVYATCFFKC